MAIYEAVQKLQNAIYTIQHELMHAYYKNVIATNGLWTSDNGHAFAVMHPSKKSSFSC